MDHWLRPVKFTLALQNSSQKYVIETALKNCRHVLNYRFNIGQKKPANFIKLPSTATCPKFHPQLTGELVRQIDPIFISSVTQQNLTLTI